MGGGGQHQTRKRKPSGGLNEKRVGVVSIGDMLDRLDLYDAAFPNHKSKNTTCTAIEISKGTVNTYQARVMDAARYGIDAKMVSGDRAQQRHSKAEQMNVVALTVPPLALCPSAFRSLSYKSIFATIVGARSVRCFAR